MLCLCIYRSQASCGHGSPRVLHHGTIVMYAYAAQRGFFRTTDQHVTVVRGLSQRGSLSTLSGCHVHVSELLTPSVPHPSGSAMRHTQICICYMEKGSEAGVTAGHNQRHLTPTQLSTRNHQYAFEMWLAGGA